VLAADDIAGWSAALGALWRDPEARGKAGAGALVQARERFSEDRYYERLMEIYQ
jgi:hypothetical protein